MRNLLRTLFILLFFQAFVMAQVVSTLTNITSVPRIEAITLNHNGYLYTPSAQGGQIFKIKHDGSSVTSIISGMGGPLGGAVDADSNFYFSEYNTGKIYKVRPDDSFNVFADGFAGPTGMVVNPGGDSLLVANYNNNSIYKVALADSSVHNWVQGNGLNGPDGLVFGPGGNLFAANFDDNKIFKISPAGQFSLFSVLNGSSNSGYLVRVDSMFYAAGFFGHRIYEIDWNGNSSVIAGIGTSSGANGAAAQAGFHRPNGMAASVTGDSIYITDGTPTAKVRVLDLKAIATARNNEKNLENTLNLSVSPNPASSHSNVSYRLPSAAETQMIIFDSAGREIARHNFGLKVAGPHSFSLQDMLSKGGIPAKGHYRLILQSGELRENLGLFWTGI